MLDILIRNGQVVDGTGASQFRGDVAIQGDRIIEVGLMERAEAQVVIDASGCAVTPGFVDVHSHADMTLPIGPTADSLVHQGITTVVIGQCGKTPAPLLDETRKEVIAAYHRDDRPLPWDQWSSFGSYLDYMTQLGISLNAVPLVGQGTIRAGVMGFGADPANDAQMAHMQGELRRAMDEGAIGVSTGLVYPPGSYASTEELVTLIRAAGEKDGFYFSHIRGEGATLLEAVAEAIRIGRETGTAVQISHFKAAGRGNWDKAGQALQLVERAQAEGLDVTVDMYPYLAGSTGLISLLPEWAQEAGTEAVLERLQRAETRKQMAADMQSAGSFRFLGWDDVLISSSPAQRRYEGQFIADLAQEADKSPTDWVFDALLEGALDLRIIIFQASETNLISQLRHPAVMIGTDGSGLMPTGPLSRGKPHPRSYGTYPRILGHYIRELNALPLEEAVRKMSGFPAQKLRWADRGLLKRGYLGDLVVFNPDTVTDRATYESPHQYPTGILHVIVNGQLVIHDGAHTQQRPGRILGR